MNSILRNFYSWAGNVTTKTSLRYWSTDRDKKCLQTCCIENTPVLGLGSRWEVV